MSKTLTDLNIRLRIFNTIVGWCSECHNRYVNTIQYYQHWAGAGAGCWVLSVVLVDECSSWLLSVECWGGAPAYGSCCIMADIWNSNKLVWTTTSSRGVGSTGCTKVQTYSTFSHIQYLLLLLTKYIILSREGVYTGRYIQIKADIVVQRPTSSRKLRPWRWSNWVASRQRQPVLYGTATPPPWHP